MRRWPPTATAEDDCCLASGSSSVVSRLALPRRHPSAELEALEAAAAKLAAEKRQPRRLAVRRRAAGHTAKRTRRSPGRLFARQTRCWRAPPNLDGLQNQPRACPSQIWPACSAVAGRRDGGPAERRAVGAPAPVAGTWRKKAHASPAAYIHTCFVAAAHPKPPKPPWGASPAPPGFTLAHTYLHARCRHGRGIKLQAVLSFTSARLRQPHPCI